MRLRRLLAVLVATLALTGAFAAPASAGRPFTDGNGSCADLRSGGGNLADSDQGGNWDTAVGEAELAGRACRNITYLMSLYTPDGNFIDDSDSPVVAANDAGGTDLTWNIAIAPMTSGHLCATLKTLDPRGNVVDEARPLPGFEQSGCVVGQPISGPPAGGWH